MCFKVGDIVKYKEYDPNSMVYYDNFEITKILLDGQGNIILVKTDVPLIKDIGIESFDRKVINVSAIELDLDYLRTEKIKTIKNAIN
jgi:hypothetical protein